MAGISQLSRPKCILLAVHFASESNIQALHHLTPDRLDAFDPKFLLRILLTFLPETTPPSTYTTYLSEAATRIYLEQKDASVIDSSAVDSLSEEEAEAKVQELQLVDLTHPLTPPNAPVDILTHFLVHRAYQIDAQCGLFSLIPDLIIPFLDRCEYLRIWYISTILPFSRMEFEFYPEDAENTSFEAFSNLSSSTGTSFILSKSSKAFEDGKATADMLGRDFRALVGPWMFGQYWRERRKASFTAHQFRTANAIQVDDSDTRPGERPVEVKDQERGNHWQHALNWIVTSAEKNLPLSLSVIEHWNGPVDVDFGGYLDGLRYMGQEETRHWTALYAQAALAAVYAAEKDDFETINGAHAILCRLSQLMDFEPPPDLATSVELLPRIGRHTNILHESSNYVLQPTQLLRPDHPLTSPNLETYAILQLFVYSAYLLSYLDKNISVVSVAKSRFFAGGEEQLHLVQRILHKLILQSRKDADQWRVICRKMLWLWHWGMDDADNADKGLGILGKIGRVVFEKELLKALLSDAQYALATSIFLESKDDTNLKAKDVEEVVLEQAFRYYDNATNCDRTRGGLKKASDLLAAFRTHFPESQSINGMEALISATHGLSFYKIILQHGVPFQPVNIRVSQDPIFLVAKVLDQNLKSYTKLDDLLYIGRNLVEADTAGVLQNSFATRNSEDLKIQEHNAEHRIIGLAVEAALAEGDFETAYSYVVNRLPLPPIPSLNGSAQASPSSSPSSSEGDIAWRAAFAAGRYRAQTNNRSTRPSTQLRNLDQRMDLLSRAILLAPSSALSEILAVWRRCEEEMGVLLAAETEQERAWNAKADTVDNIKISGEFEPQRIVQQPRRELGRMTAVVGREGEAPIGLFDVARGAAQAFSRTAFPLRSSAASINMPSVNQGKAGMQTQVKNETSARSQRAGSDGSVGDTTTAAERVRKRDMVANAVTGGLASGLGWVLGK